MRASAFLHLATTCMAVAASSCGSPPDRPGPGSALDLSGLYDAGMPFESFLAQTEQRRDIWNGNYRTGAVPDSTLAAGEAVGGQWRLLVVAEDWCGDSANTVPYAALLARALESLDLRVVRSREGRGVMEAFLTPDGRAATPTMVLLGESGEVAGCLVEQPRPLQEWWLGPALEIDDADARFQRKYDWYASDAGASTMAEIVGLMEAAAAGARGCTAGAVAG